MIDTDYATLERWACGAAPLPAAPVAGAGVIPTQEPALWPAPPPGLSALATSGGRLPGAQAVAGRNVWLVHPWALADLPADPPDNTLCCGVWPQEAHAAWPWSARRWAFVADRMAALGAPGVLADSAMLRQALAGAASVHCTDNLHLPAGWPAAWRQPAPRLLADPARLCGSFSQFWRQALRGVDRLEDLPGWPAGGPLQARLFDPN